MWRVRRWMMAGLIVACGGASAAQDAASNFSHKDWELACDNTRTCRAAGYQSESGESEPVSMLITRAAGPATPVEMQLQVMSEAPVKGTLTLSVGKVRFKGLPVDGAQLTPAQVRELLPAMLKADAVALYADGQTWTLSLAGLNAALLRMDELQQRLGTPGALVRPGRKPEGDVLPALPLPQVRAVRPVATRTGDAALVKPLFEQIPATDLEVCNDPNPELAVVHRLTHRQVLLALPCGMGAYNGSELLWIANDKAPYQPRLLDVDGSFDRQEGSVHSAMKVRGIGDCWAVRTWQFTGQGFTLTGESVDGMCRGFAGGAWQLPRHVTQVIGP